jgi:integrase/recombinase XerD
MLDPVEEAARRRQCMDARELTVPLEKFARHLADLGHTPLTIAGYSGGVRHFGEWLHGIRVCPAQIDDKIVVRFARHRCRCPGIREHRCLSAKYVIRVRRFVAFLAGEGIITLSSPVPTPPVNDRVAAFQMWLREHRGAFRTDHRSSWPNDHAPAARARR